VETAKQHCRIEAAPDSHEAADGRGGFHHYRISRQRSSPAALGWVQGGARFKALKNADGQLPIGGNLVDMFVQQKKPKKPENIHNHHVN
jgi:hypothetical protein